MLTAESSRLAHALQNPALLTLSFLLLPLDTVILILRYAAHLLVAESASIHYARHPRTVLVTGVGLTKGLVLARLFFLAGHRVVGADVEPANLPISCGHLSRYIEVFHHLSKPNRSRDGAARYCQSTLGIV
jgi:catechol O-methyltransferase